MPSIEQFTTRLVNNPPAGSRIRSHLTLPPAPPPFGPPCSTCFSPPFAAMLRSQGIQRLTEHQWHTLRCVQQGRHVCISVPPGGGRDVTCLLALYQSLRSPAGGHALCVFPQKHHERRLFRMISVWNESLPPEDRLIPEIYDGDTPNTRRRAIKQSPPTLLLTTPEMLHTSILAYHGGWRTFFQNLRFLVLTDLHLCAGALGAHLAHLWRRLLRVSRHYGATPQALITSTPLGNLRPAAEALCGQPCTVVSGAAWLRAAQSRLMLEIPDAACSVLPTLLARSQETGAPWLIFAAADPDWEKTVHTLQMEHTILTCQRPVTPEAYRKAEHRLRHGEAAALLLPPDIPADVLHPSTTQRAMFIGVPSSLTHLHDCLAMLASRSTPSLSLLALHGHTALERYLLHHPAVYHTPWLQNLPLDPSNPLLTRQHLLCAATELAPKPGEQYPEVSCPPERVHQSALNTARSGHTAEPQRRGKRSLPHRNLHLRAYEPAFAIVHHDDGSFITTLDPEQAFRETFEGAIWQLAGRTFRVHRYLADRRRIVVQPTPTHYHTRGVVKAYVTNRRLETSIATETFRMTYGTLNYVETLVAFERLAAHTRTRTSLHTLAERHRQFPTRGVWFDFPSATVGLDWQTAMHTLVHAILTGLPLLLPSKAEWVTGGMSDQDEPGVAGPTAVLIDAQPGGNGVSACLFRSYEHVLRGSLHLLLHCDCQYGCSRCLTQQRCDACGGPAGLDRQAGIRLLQAMLGEGAPTLEQVRLPGEPAESPQRQAQPPRYLYLSLTTQKSADEVGGWQHKHLLGLGIAVTYDTHDRCYRLYTAETVVALVESLRAADLVIGFNPRDFDYQVLQPYTDVPLATLPTLAILDEVQRVLGFRLSFSHLVQETLGLERADESAQTPRWFQEGGWNRLIDHGQRDITLLRELVRYGLRRGTLICRERSGERRAIPVTWPIHDG